MAYASSVAAVTPPVQGQNVWVLAGSSYGTSDYVEVPADWKNALLTLSADGDKFYVAFAPADNASAVKTGTSTVTSNAFTAIGANNMAVIFDGEKMHVNMTLLDKIHTGLVLIVQSDAGAGYLRIERSGGPVSVE